MPAKLYVFSKQLSSTAAAKELAAAIREVAPNLRMIAEAERRRQIIRTIRMIAQRQRPE